MPDVETLSARLRTVEQAVTDGDCSFPEATELSEIETRLGAVEDHLDDLEHRIDELDAATQALRGYVGNVRSVNEDVEQRADAALAATERLEARLDDTNPRQPSKEKGAQRPPGERRSSGRTVENDTRPAKRDSLRERVDASAERTMEAPMGLDDETETEPDDDAESGVLARVRRLL